jgi:hypothetical protein
MRGVPVDQGNLAPPGRLRWLAVALADPKAGKLNGWPARPTARKEPYQQGNDEYRDKDIKQYLGNPGRRPCNSAEAEDCRNNRDNQKYDSPS